MISSCWAAAAKPAVAETSEEARAAQPREEITSTCVLRNRNRSRRRHQAPSATKIFPSKGSFQPSGKKRVPHLCAFFAQRWERRGLQPGEPIHARRSCQPKLRSLPRRRASHEGSGTATHPAAGATVDG